MQEEISFNSYQELANEAQLYQVELEDWLSRFSSGPKKWPDINIARKRKRLEFARKVEELCRRAETYQQRRAAQ